MKMIVGLGNPGKNYAKTRHNVGYMVVDNYALKKGINIDKRKFNSLYQILSDKDLLLIKPETFMNLSGEAVLKFANYYKIKESDIFVICDDLDLNCGKIRLRDKGSSGGHNGIKDIINKLNSDQFKRLKIGISNNKNVDTKDYVLGKFSSDEIEILNSSIKITEDIIDDFLIFSFDKLMNKYNHR